MKAIIFDNAGEPEKVLTLAEIVTPPIPPGSVLVRVTARLVQPADLAFIRGPYRIHPRFPQTAGLEGAGVVVQAGDGASIHTGQRVALLSQALGLSMPQCPLTG